MEKTVARGDIWWVDLGAPQGSAQAGRRPVVVVSNDTGNRLSSTVIVATVTTRHLREYPFTVRLSPGEGGLARESFIDAAQLRTLDKGLLERQAGRLDPSRMAEVNEALKISLALDIDS